MAASLRRREQKNVHCWKMLPSSEVKTVTQITSLCVTVIATSFVLVSNNSDY
jgi:hypothetical protein